MITWRCGSLRSRPTMLRRSVRLPSVACRHSWSSFMMSSTLSVRTSTSWMNAIALLLPNGAPSLHACSGIGRGCRTGAVPAPYGLAVRKSRIFFVLASAAIVAACSSTRTASQTSTTTTMSRAASATSTTAGDSTPTLDPNHDYGDRYADGILPVGDGRYTTDAAQPGSVFLCHMGGPNAGGASTRGPWFSADGTTYDVNKKISVQGAVTWPGNITITVDGDTRTIVSNDLPKDHATGVFPIARDDPAHAIDANPNSIKAQSITYRLVAFLTVRAPPH